MTSIKVLFNFMIRLKRFFFVKKINDFSDCQPSTNQAISTRQNNEIDFLCSIDHEDMENLVKGNVEPTSQYEMYTQYLDTLISDENNSILKDEIETLLEFVSEITMEEISVKSIESMQKKGRRKSNIDIQSLATEESKADEKDKPEEHVFTPLDTSKSIMAIKCSPRVSKIICKYFSNPQNDDKSAPQKGVSSKVDSKALDPLNLYIFHYCMPQNKMTYDSYYIVKNIIYSILEKCPEILSFFKLIDLDINLDLFLNSSETIRLDHTEIFIRFLKKLRELKLDYNIVICISQADLAYNKNYLCNFIFLLRHAIKHSPTYIKFILTFTSSSLIQLDEILRVLLINSGVEANSLEIDEALTFEKHSLDALEILGIEEDKIQPTLDKCDNNFERILDVAEMIHLGHKIDDILSYDCNLKNLFQLKLAEVENKDQIEHIITMMCVLQIPASTEFLSRI